MALSMAPWLGPVLADNFTFFQLLQVTNPYFRHTDLCPNSPCVTEHMLKAIVIKNEALKLLRCARIEGWPPIGCLWIGLHFCVESVHSLSGSSTTSFYLFFN